MLIVPVCIVVCSPVCGLGLVAQVCEDASITSLLISEMSHWPVCSYDASFTSLCSCPPHSPVRPDLWVLPHLPVCTTSLVAPVCEVLAGGVVGDSSRKSQKPLYFKLKKTIPKHRTSLLIQFCDCCLPTLQQRSSPAWVRKEGLFLSGEYCQETLLLLLDKWVQEKVSTGVLQLSKTSRRQKIRKVNSMEASKQMKSVKE